jgi:cytochrome c5
MKIKFVILTLAVVSLTFCKSKKSGETVSTKPIVKEELSADLKASAEARYPGVAVADILEGQKLYYSKCGKCHGLPEVESQTEAKWPEWMDDMAPKANLDAAQKEKTLKYVLSARDIKVKR